MKGDKYYKGAYNWKASIEAGYDQTIRAQSLCSISSYQMRSGITSPITVSPVKEEERNITVNSDREYD